MFIHHGHHQQQPQEPYHWQKFQGQVPQNAVHASDTYVVAKAKHEGQWIPAKLNLTDRSTYFAHNMKEVHATHDIEVLVSDAGSLVEWVPASHGQVPQGAVGPMGNDNCYIGRVMCPKPDNKYASGKIHPAHRCLYLPFDGKEMKFDNYEVLVIKGGHYNQQPYGGNSTTTTTQPFGPTPTVGPSSNSPYNWVPYHGSTPQHAVAAGPNYVVIRANHNGDWVPGKLNLAQRAAYVPFGGKEVHVTSNIEVLTHAPGAEVVWVKASHGQVPSNTVGPLGKEGTYVGRAICPKPESTETPGKIHPTYKHLYIAWDGKEHEVDNYEACVIQFPQHNQYPSFQQVTINTQPGFGQPNFQQQVHIQPGFGQPGFHQQGFGQPNFAPSFNGPNQGQFGQPHFNTPNMPGFGQGNFGAGGHFGSHH